MFPLRDATPRRTTPVITWLIIAANAAVFYYQLGLSEHDLVGLLSHSGIVPSRFTRVFSGGPAAQLADYRSFITSMFMHGGWIHLISNMWALWIFGDNVEDRMGHTRYLSFYLICGLVAGATHVYFNTGSDIPVVGASGALSGVLGAYLVLFPLARVLTLVPVFFLPLLVEIPAVVFIGLWFLAQYAGASEQMTASTNGEGIAWWAHIGGFVAGLALVWRFRRRRDSRR